MTEPKPLTVGSVAFGPQTRPEMPVVRLIPPEGRALHPNHSPVPKWRACDSCQGMFSIGAPAWMNGGAFVVTFCPFCGGSHLKIIPHDEAVKLLAAGPTR